MSGENPGESLNVKAVHVALELKTPHVLDSRITGDFPAQRGQFEFRQIDLAWIGEQRARDSNVAEALLTFTKRKTLAVDAGRDSVIGLAGQLGVAGGLQSTFRTGRHLE